MSATARRAYCSTALYAACKRLLRSFIIIEYHKKPCDHNDRPQGGDIHLCYQGKLSVKLRPEYFLVLSCGPFHLIFRHQVHSHQYLA